MAGIIPKSEALKIAREIVGILIEKGLNYTLVHKQEKKQIVFTSVKHCDTVIKFIPTFEYEWNNGARYCEMVLNYE